jgi:hypothetical protein
MGAGCAALDFISFFSDNWQRSHLAAAQQTRPLCSSAHVFVEKKLSIPKWLSKYSQTIHLRSTPHQMLPARSYANAAASHYRADE